MRTFKDNADRTWNVRVTVATVKAVKDELDINLLSLPEDSFALLRRWATDPVLLVATLYVVCQKQAKDLEVSPEAFGEAMYGDVISVATDALTRSVVDFFPEARSRASLDAVIDKGTELGELLLTKLEAETAKLGELDMNSVATKLIDSFGSVPES